MDEQQTDGGYSDCHDARSSEIHARPDGQIAAFVRVSFSIYSVSLCALCRFVLYRVK
jgi:hypothetical protein